MKTVFDKGNNFVYFDNEADREKFYVSALTVNGKPKGFAEAAALNKQKNLRPYAYSVETGRIAFLTEK